MVNIKIELVNKVTKYPGFLELKWGKIIQWVRQQTINSTLPYSCDQESQ